MERSLLKAIPWVTLMLCLLAACAGSSVTVADTDPLGDPVTDIDPTVTVDEPPPAEDSTADSTASPEVAAVPTNLPKPGTADVVLLDAGSEPRIELRLMIAASCTEITTAEQIQEIAQTLDGAPGPGSGAFGTSIEMATTATRVGDDYEVRAEIIQAMAAPGTAPAQAAALNAQLSNAVGLTVYTTMTPRGIQIPGTTRVEGAEALGPLGEAVEAMAQTQSPVPEEAVGVGAKWRTTSVIDFQGVALANISEAEILSINGTVIEVRIKGYQEVEIGAEMDLQGIPAIVTEWESATVGTTTIDLATISPIRMSAVVDARQGFEFGASFGGGLLEQEISSAVTMTSEPDAGCTGRTTRP